MTHDEDDFAPFFDQIDDHLQAEAAADSFDRAARAGAFTPPPCCGSRSLRMPLTEDGETSDFERAEVLHRPWCNR